MINRCLVLLTTCTLLLFVAACGGGDGDDGNGDGDAEQEQVEPAGSATISGTVHFDGTAPEREELELNRECTELRDSPPLSQNVVVNDDETLKWVFVYVKDGLGDQSFGTPQEAVVLDQEGCMYKPHVFGAQTGQSITIRNSDPFQHNIHALPETNRPFNFSQPMRDMEQERSFPEEEVMVRIKCDVHGWMESWVGVLGHPYHSTTEDEGAYSLDNLPAGDYVVEAWHEEYGTQTDSVEVGDGESTTLDFTFSSSETADVERPSDMRLVTWTIDH